MIGTDKYTASSQTRYPFQEDIEMLYNAGGHTMPFPDSAVLDASVSSYDGTAAVCYLGGFEAHGNGTTVFRFNVCGHEVDLEVPAGGTHSPVSTKPTAGTHVSVLFGRDGIAALREAATLDQFYSRASTHYGLIEPSCVLYSPASHVDGFIGDAPGSSLVYGSVRVLPGINTSVRVSPNSNTVTILALPGAGLPNCIPQGGAEADVLRMLNGIRPDADGNVYLPVGGGLSIRRGVDSNELILSAAVTREQLDCDKPGGP